MNLLLRNILLIFLEVYGVHSSPPTSVPSAGPRTMSSSFPSSGPSTMSSAVCQYKIGFLGFGDWGKGGVNGDIRSISSGSNVHALANDDPGGIYIADGNNKQAYTYQVAMAGSMNEWIVNDHEIQFVVALGDNFYGDGVSSTTDQMWVTHWSEVYLEYNSLKVPWYSVFGNHDYGYGEQGLQAQIDRSTAGLDAYWSTPASTYTKIFKLCGGGSVQIVFTDTTVLAPSQTRATYEGISEEQQAARIAAVQESLTIIFEESMKDPPDWLLLMGHYPIYSTGSHGDNEELLQNLLPFFEKYNVNAYFSGHDHVSEVCFIANSMTKMSITT